MIDDKAIVNGLIDAIYENAIADYKIAHRADIDGKTIISNGWRDTPMEVKKEVTLFLRMFFDAETVSLMLHELRKQALNDGRAIKGKKAKKV